MSDIMERKFSPESGDPLNRRISELDPISEARNTEVESRERLDQLVEQPLLAACRILYDRNIRTLESSANKQALAHGYAYIAIDYDALSTKNQEIGRTLGEVSLEEGINSLEIRIPISEETKLWEIEEKSVEMVSKFQKQKYRVMVYTLEEMRERNLFDPQDEKYGPDAFPQYYWSSDENLFYISKEQYDKAHEEVEE